MKILSKLDNTGMIDEVANKRYVTDAEKLAWNNKADKTYVDNQDALKADKTYVDNKVKTDVPVGAKFTDTVYTHPASHPASMITGLPTSLPANGGNATTSKHLVGDDTRSVDSSPSVYMKNGSRYVNKAGWQTEFKNVSTIGLTGLLSGTYCYLQTHTPWADPSGGYPIQVAYGDGTPCWRVGVSTSAWSAWQKMSDGGNANTVNGFTVGVNVPANAKFTDTVYSHPASHPASMITGLPTGKKVARFIVGTSTAGWTSADCDYLCDGTADETEINAAINALPATGGEIVILDGVYNITAKIDVTKDNVSIKGNGDATILKRMFSSFGHQGVITLIGRSGCKIADLQVDGNKANYTGYADYGIYLEGSSNNTITGNYCSGNSGVGICLNYSSNDNIITGNTNNNNNYGINLEEASNNTITGNANNNNGYGINLNYSSNNTITGNYCSSNNYGGISLESLSNNNTITGNTGNNNDVGIYLGGSSNNTVTGNTCNDNNVSGIYLEFSSINTVTGNTGIRGTGLATDYTASQHTIWLSSTDNNYNLISNNNCMGKAVTNEGGTGNTIIDNKWSNSSGRILENYTEQLVTLSGISITIDLSLANVFAHSLTGNTTYTITNAVNGQAHSFTLIINQTATVRTLTFPSSVKWQGGEIPDLSAASKTYVLTFMTVDGGITWLGMFGGEF